MFLNFSVEQEILVFRGKVINMKENITFIENIIDEENTEKGTRKRKKGIIKGYSIYEVR